MQVLEDMNNERSQEGSDSNILRAKPKQGYRSIVQEDWKVQGRNHSCLHLEIYRKPSSRKNPAMNIVALWSSGRRDIAKRHDDYLTSFPPTDR